MPVTIDKISGRPMLHSHDIEDIKDIDIEIITQNFYGVSRQVGQTSSVLTRIGNMDLHKVNGGLPIQNAMRRCLLLADGTVNYYLHDTDSTKKYDGSAANLTGTDGNVMVEIPEFYIQFSESEAAGITTQNVLISAVAIPGYTKVEKHYISAYEAALNRSTLKASSVVNTTTTYRGGNNDATNDANEKTLLGKPVTDLTRPEQRLYSLNNGAGWCIEPYEFYNIWRWLYIIEFANTNIQLAVNATLTFDGYRQGGLGNGLTNANNTEWGAFNSYQVICPTGHTNSLGNVSGEKDLTIVNFGGSGINRTFKVNSFRGIENPFGHIFKRIEGININRTGGQVLAYGKKGTADFVDDTSLGYEYLGLLPYSNTYILDIIFGNSGIILPETTGGSETTGFCDYYSFATSDGWKAPQYSGGPTAGGGLGLFSLTINQGAEYKSTFLGFRICFKTP